MTMHLLRRVRHLSTGDTGSVVRLGADAALVEVVFWDGGGVGLDLTRVVDCPK